MRYLSVSRRWLSDYGLGERDLIGESHYDIFPEITAEWREAHRRGLAGEVLRAEADRFERADGSVQWMRWEIRPWHDAEGKIGGIVIFAEDITDIKLAEEVLRRYELLARYSRDIILFMRRDDGRILEANAAAVNTYGYVHEELLELTIKELRAPETVAPDRLPDGRGRHPRHPLRDRPPPQGRQHLSGGGQLPGSDHRWHTHPDQRHSRHHREEEG